MIDESSRLGGSTERRLKMKSEKEIAKRIHTGLGVIINCRKGCANKPPGLYCTMCDRLYQEAEVLSWVTGKDLRRDHRAQFEEEYEK